MAEFVRLPHGAEKTPFMLFLLSRHGAGHCFALLSVLLHLCRTEGSREITRLDFELICEQCSVPPDELLHVATKYGYLHQSPEGLITSDVAEQWMQPLDESRRKTAERVRTHRERKKRSVTVTDVDATGSNVQRREEKRREDKTREDKKRGDARDPAREGSPPPEVEICLEMSKNEGIPEAFAKPRIAEYSARGWLKASGSPLRTSHEVAAAIATRWHESEGDRYRSQTQSVTPTTGAPNGIDQAIALMEQRAADARARAAAQPAR